MTKLQKLNEELISINEQLSEMETENCFQGNRYDELTDRAEELEEEIYALKGHIW